MQAIGNVILVNCHIKQVVTVSPTQKVNKISEKKTADCNTSTCYCN